MQILQINTQTQIPQQTLINVLILKNLDQCTTRSQQNRRCAHITHNFLFGLKNLLDLLQHLLELFLHDELFILRAMDCNQSNLLVELHKTLEFILECYNIC